jgi:hypothetical protein
VHAPAYHELDTFTPTQQTIDSELIAAVYNALAPASHQNQSQDIAFPHSDEEELESLSNPLPPNSTVRPTSPTLSQSTPKKKMLPCDPGIIRTPTIDRSSTTRWILRFDKNIPRPNYALTPTFGHLPGLYIGKRWHSRMGTSWDGTHTPTIAGIAGRSAVGAWSIALSGGYEDDFDEGYRFVYTGSGGRDLKVLFL